MKTFDIYYMQDGQKCVVASITGKTTANKELKRLKKEFMEHGIYLMMN